MCRDKVTGKRVTLTEMRNKVQQELRISTMVTKLGSKMRKTNFAFVVVRFNEFKLISRCTI